MMTFDGHLIFDQRIELREKKNLVDERHISLSSKALQNIMGAIEYTAIEVYIKDGTPRHTTQLSCTQRELFVEIFVWFHQYRRDRE